MRKISESLSGTPEVTESAEARSDRQSGGQIQVGLTLGGDITGENASSGCFHDQILAAMKYGTWAAEVNSSAEAYVIAAGPPGTITGTGDFVADGFEVGDMVRINPNDPAYVGTNGVMVYVTAVTATTLDVIGRGLEDGVMPATTTIDRPEYAEIGQTDQSFTFEKNFLDLTDKSILYAGMLVDTMALSFAYGEIASIGFGYVGNGYDTPAIPATETGSASVLPATAEIAFNATSDIGLVITSNEAGDPINADFCIQNISLDLSNNSQAEQCIGDLAPGAYAQGTASVAVAMSGYLANENFFYIQKKITQEPVEICYYAENQDGGIAVHVFEAQLSFDDPAAGGRDQIVTLDMSGTAKYSDTYQNTMRIYKW